MATSTALLCLDAAGNDIHIRSARGPSKPSGPCHRCQTCNQRFKARKSLLRHVRTIHQRSTFECPQCNEKFARKDIRDRHVSERHSNTKRIVKCDKCGRYLSKRAFPEHLDSDICRYAASNDVHDARLEQGVKYAGPEDDPFLAALRMFKFFERRIHGSARVTFPVSVSSLERSTFYARIKLRLRTLTDETTLIKYENIAIRLLKDGLSNAKASLRSLARGALLLGAMALAGPRALNDKARAHFSGAYRLFKLYHESVCQCSRSYRCEKLSPIFPDVIRLDGLFREFSMASGMNNQLISETEVRLSLQDGHHTIQERPETQQRKNLGSLRLTLRTSQV